MGDDVAQLDPTVTARGSALAEALARFNRRVVNPVVRPLARFNRRVVNPVVRPLAGRMSGMAVVCHIGRRTGRRFETPVRVFGTGGTFYVMVLSERLPDWARNLQTAGGGSLRVGGRSVAVGLPRLTDDAEALAAASRYQRRWRRVIGVRTTYVALEAT
jgi:deazaflavin-dependent oxidoreductase (nitroreductase family)